MQAVRIAEVRVNVFARQAFFQKITTILVEKVLVIFFLWRCGPTQAMAYSFLRFLDHTQRRITVGRTALDE